MVLQALIITIGRDILSWSPYKANFSAKYLHTDTIIEDDKPGIFLNKALMFIFTRIIEFELNNILFKYY